MEQNWDPLKEHVEGKLCESGLLVEKFDIKGDDLVRSLTPLGRTTALNLLKDPGTRNLYLFLAKKQFSKYPEEVQKQLWKNLANQLKEVGKDTKN